MWNIPNTLTLARLGVLPIVVFLVWPGIESRETCSWAALLYGCGAVLDVVDGYIARRYDMVTVFGKFLDPLADKLYYLVTLIALLQLPGQRIPPWVVMVVITRELAITGLRGIAVSEGVVIAAGEGGKIKTTFATIGAGMLLLHYPYMLDFGLFSLHINFHRVGLWATYLSVAFSVVSALQYVRGFVQAHRAKESPATAGGDTPGE